MTALLRRGLAPLFALFALLTGQAALAAPGAGVTAVTTQLTAGFADLTTILLACIAAVLTFVAMWAGARIAIRTLSRGRV